MTIKAKSLKVIHTCGSLSHAHDVIGSVHTPASPGNVLWGLEGSAGFIEYCPYCGQPLPGKMTWEVNQ